MTMLTLKTGLVGLLGVVVAVMMMGSVVVDAQVDADQVTYLPFLNGTLWPQWSGYATVNETHGRALHYWFVQSQSSDPTSDPVVLWYVLLSIPSVTSFHHSFKKHEG